MNLFYTFERWGLSEQTSVAQLICNRHNSNRGRTALQVWDIMMSREYKPQDIPGKMMEWSPILGGSIVDILTRIDNGAEELIKIAERDL